MRAVSTTHISPEPRALLHRRRIFPSLRLLSQPATRKPRSFFNEKRQAACGYPIKLQVWSGFSRFRRESPVLCRDTWACSCFAMQNYFQVPYPLSRPLPVSLVSSASAVRCAHFRSQDRPELIEEEHVRITKAGCKPRITNPGIKNARLQTQDQTFKDRKVTTGFAEEILELRPDKGSRAVKSGSCRPREFTSTFSRALTRPGLPESWLREGPFSRKIFQTIIRIVMINRTRSYQFVLNKHRRRHLPLVQNIQAHSNQVLAISFRKIRHRTDQSRVWLP